MLILQSEFHMKLLFQSVAIYLFYKSLKTIKFYLFCFIYVCMYICIKANIYYNKSKVKYFNLEIIVETVFVL